MSITARMLAAKEEACFTVSVMATWFYSSYSAMSSWLGRSEPHEPNLQTAKQLEPLMVLLERALKHMPGILPVPLEIRQRQRREYIKKVRDDAFNRFSKTGSAGRRDKVLGKNKQK